MRSGAEGRWEALSPDRSQGPLLEKTWKKGSSFPGNFVVLREKIQKYIREICHSGGKFCPDCREIDTFPGLPRSSNGKWRKLVEIYCLKSLSVSSANRLGKQIFIPIILQNHFNELIYQKATMDISNQLDLTRNITGIFFHFSLMHASPDDLNKTRSKDT